MFDAKTLYVLSIYSFPSGIMKSRRLEHITGDTFKDSEGKKVLGKLLTKKPVLLHKHMSDLSGRAHSGTLCMGSWIDEHWELYSKMYGGAEGYVLSWGTGLGDNVLFCAVNFYKVKPAKGR